MNLQGRVFMANNDDPFRKADELLKQIKARVIVLDMHAEATSEKMAMGWYLDGRVTAVLGTHTHVTRYTFTHNMIKAGATLNEVQDRLGHESLATTGRYARVLTSAENRHADKLASMLGIE